MPIALVGSENGEYLKDKASADHDQHHQTRVDGK